MDLLCKTERLSAAIAFNAGAERAAQIIKAGGTVAFPTETVYGLGADAFNILAIARVFLAKQRPAWDPLIVHISNPAMLREVAIVPRDFEALLDNLAERFWPGPLTLLLPRSARVPDAVTAGRPLVGVRMPAHPVALELIRRAGTPLAAPSANRFGHTSPTTAAHVLDDLDGRIDAVLDGGPAQIGIESTVLDPLQSPMMIYRPGAVTADMVREATGREAILFNPPVPEAGFEAENQTKSLPSPGVGLRHYAPRAQVKLVRSGADDLGGTFLRQIHALKQVGERVGAMLPTGWDAGEAIETFDLGDWRDNPVFARRLFAGLRSLDARAVSVIVCPVPEGDGLARALVDRLEKASRSE